MLPAKRRLAPCNLLASASPDVSLKRATTGAQRDIDPALLQRPPPLSDFMRCKLRASHSWLFGQRADPGWRARLVACVSPQGRIPAAHRTPLPAPEQPNPPRRKLYRAAMPDAERRRWLAALAQNSPDWDAERCFSEGASILSALTGWSDYSTNKDEWYVAVGLQARRKPRDYMKDQFACDHGHYREDECAAVYQAASGIRGAATGMHLHPLNPKMHCSPDLLIDAGLDEPLAPGAPRPVACHNRHAICDPPQGLAEIKNPLKHAYVYWSDKEQQWVPTIPPQYLPQVLNQIDNQGRAYCDFISLWRFNEFEAGGRALAEPVPAGEGKFKYAEFSWLRVYRNQPAADAIRRVVEQHIEAVERAQREIDAGRTPAPPPVADRLDLFGATVVLPMLHVAFYTQLEDASAASALDPQTGELLGERLVARDGESLVEVNTFWDAKPRAVTVFDLEKNLPGVELTCTPTYLQHHNATQEFA